MISLRALGPLEARMDDAEAPADLLWTRNLALLLYLARAPSHRCTRDHAMGLLWPEKDQERSRQSLREALRVLRRHVGENGIRTEADQLELTAGAIDLDTDRFDQLVAKQDWAGASALVKGGFAEGFALPDASPFEDWLLAERWHWRGRCMDVLIRHAEARLDAGDLLGADNPARRALDIDPLSERALRTMLRRLALAEDHAGALSLYEQYVQRIKRERSSPLEPETQQLVERIRNGRRWKLPQTVAPRVPLFGRDADLSAIMGQWRAVRTSKRLALVVLEAEPGYGKSRLAQEATARVALDGGASVTTRTVSADRQQHLSGILSLVRGGLVDVAGAAAAPPAALGALAHESSEWAERFPAAARAPSAQSLSGAVTEVLRVASAEQPLLLVFDDAQWLDDASLDQLEIIVRDLARAPLLLLLTTTRESSSPRLAALRARIGRDVPGVVVTPDAFAEDDLQAIVRWAIPAYTPEQVDRLARRLLVDAAGVPLLAVEICRAVAQGMDLERMSGAWPRPLHTLDHTMPGDLPETIVGALRVGFSCLSPSAAGALKAAAVLGESERIPAARIGQGARLEGAALDAALDELEWRSWLTADARGYSFVARIVRDVVERDMVTEGERHRILSA